MINPRIPSQRKYVARFRTNKILQDKIKKKSTRKINTNEKKPGRIGLGKAHGPRVALLGLFYNFCFFRNEIHVVYPVCYFLKKNDKQHISYG